jgi:parallel beta-helix repeat protein
MKVYRDGLKRLVSVVAMVAVIAAGALCGAARAGALVVDPAGSGAGVYRTIAEALRNLKRGDVLTIRGGTYRESIDLRTASALNNVSSTRTTIQGASAERVIINGADVVTGWQALGNGLYVKSSWTVNSQQVILDSVPLQQIGGTIFKDFPHNPNSPLHHVPGNQNGGIWPGRIGGGLSAIRDNSFYHDAGAGKLYVKVPASVVLTDHRVEVSVRTYSMVSFGLDNLTFQHLEFQYSNTSAIERHATVTLNGKNLIVDQIKVALCDIVGLDIGGSNNIVRNCSANRCGMLGMKVAGDGFTLSNNETSFNNTRGFNRNFETGGIKYIGLNNADMVGHRAYFNNGNGIWLDWNQRNNRIHNSSSAYNTGDGLYFEASFGGRIYNNYFFGNGIRGMFLLHSSTTLLAHNLSVGNGSDGIVVMDEGGRNPNLDLEPKGNRVIGNLSGWNRGTTELTLPPHLLDNRSDGNLFLSAPAQPGFAIDWAYKGRFSRGLAAWQSASALDRSSTEKVTALPASVANAINAKSTSVDWAAVFALRSGLSVQYPFDPVYQNYPDVVIGGKPPGPY